MNAFDILGHLAVLPQRRGRKRKTGPLAAGGAAGPLAAGGAAGPLAAGCASAVDIMGFLPGAPKERARLARLL